MRRIFLPVLLCSTMAAAGRVYTAVVTHESGHYFVEVDALVEVAEARARDLLTDYNHLDRVNPAVEVSEILSHRGSGDYRVRTVTRACVWFFCKRIHQVQDVTEGRDGSITAKVIPEKSDFRHGYARVDLWPEAAGTRILIRSEVVPDFWIPPLIGPWMIKNKLRSEALATVRNIERVASSEPLRN
ncbi:MAG: hypothetical protein J5I92_08445 [Thiogranum sp.]|nr:hypothetical protein [Thiogranum sp.]